MTDAPQGMRLETAASVILRDLIGDYTRNFLHVIKNDRLTGQGVVAAYIDGLAGAISLTVAGGHGSRAEVLSSVRQKLYEAVDRDLQHLGRRPA